MEKALRFLEEIKNNNNRSWFAEHRKTYDEARAEVEDLVSQALTLLREHDEIETETGKKSMQRIYRDVRFSKDKTPYKTHFGGKFTRSGNLKRGGYYYHFEPGNHFVAAAFWAPSKEDLALIRSHLAQDPSPLARVVQSSAFRESYGKLKGEKLKLKPKGYDKDHPHIEWLKYKQYLVFKEFTDAEVYSKNFYKSINIAFKGIRPFLEVMSEMLTTDLNGEELYR